MSKLLAKQEVFQHAQDISAPAELQGHMWASLISGFLMRLTIGLIRTCAWWLGTVTCQKSQKGVMARIVYSNQWKSSSNCEVHVVHVKTLTWTTKVLFTELLNGGK